MSLFRAACGGHTHIVDFLFHRGANDPPALTSGLIEAARYGHLKMIQYLASHGVTNPGVLQQAQSVAQNNPAIIIYLKSLSSSLSPPASPSFQSPHLTSTPSQEAPSSGSSTSLSGSTGSCDSSSLPVIVITSHDDSSTTKLSGLSAPDPDNNT